MKKLFIIFLVLIGCIRLVSCATGPRKGDILYPVPTSDIPSGTSEALKRPSSTGRISIEEFNEKEIVFMTWISLRATWLEYVIVDDEENSISEESFYHETIGAYRRKMKAKEEFTFRKGKNYALHIGRKLITEHPVYGRFQLLYSYKFVL